jgi:hypothetical protein
MTEWEPSLKQRMFVGALAKLVAPMQASEATGALLDMLPSLKHLPDAIFDRPGDLAAEIAADMDRVPTLARLRKALEARAARDRPAGAIMPPGLANAVLSGEDRMAVRVWLERDADGSLSQHDLAMRLAVVRRFNEAGFRWLIGHNTRALAIAESSGWVPRETVADDFTDPGRILASVRNIVDPPHPQAGYWLGALRAAVERNAPHLAELVPLDLAEIEASGPERRPTAKQAADMRADDGVVKVDRPVDNSLPKRKPGQLSPEQMRALRMADPLLRQVVGRQEAAKAKMEQIRRDFNRDPDPDPDDIPWDLIGSE